MKQCKHKKHLICPLDEPNSPNRALWYEEFVEKFPDKAREEGYTGCECFCPKCGSLYCQNCMIHQ